MPFKPKFTITPRIAISLMRIEAAKQAVQHPPITPSVLASLRESSRFFSTHYSTMIEGNRLTQEQVAKVIGKQEHFPGRERDEKEVLGHYAALAKVEQLAAGTIIVTEQHVQNLKTSASVRRKPLDPAWRTVRPGCASSIPASGKR